VCVDGKSPLIAEANGMLQVIGKFVRLGQSASFDSNDVVANNCLSLLVNLCCNGTSHALTLSRSLSLSLSLSLSRCYSRLTRW